MLKKKMRPTRAKLQPPKGTDPRKWKMCGKKYVYETVEAACWMAAVDTVNWYSCPERSFYNFPHFHLTKRKQRVLSRQH